MKKYILLLVSSFFSLSIYSSTLSYSNIWQLYAECQYDKGLKEIEVLLEQDSTQSQLHFLRGKFFEKLYKYQEAIFSYEKSRQMKESKENLTALASLYLEVGQVMKSVELYNRLDKLEPKSIYTTLKASSLFKAGYIQPALEAFLCALQNDSTNWIIHKYIGDCYFRLNKYSKSMESYCLAANYFPQQLELQARLASLYLKFNKLDSAEKVSKTIISIDSVNIDGLRSMGIVKFRQNNIVESQKYFKKLLNLGDSSLVVLNYQGILAYKKYELNNNSEDLEDAELYLEKSSKLDPENINTIYYLAICKRKLDKGKEGLLELSRIDSIFTQNDSLKVRVDEERGYLYRSLWEYYKAAEVFRSLVERKPDNSKYYYEVGASYDFAFEKQKALNWYKKFLTKIDSNWEAKVHDQEKDRPTYKSVAIGRVEALTIDLFHEGKANKNN